MDRIENVLVFGSSGEMGTLFMESMNAAGINVVGLDKDNTIDDLERELPKADLVLLCVPIVHMGTVLGRIAPMMDSERTILADVCSVKEWPVQQMQAAYAGPVVGTHPLFGGKLPDPEDRKVALVPVRGAMATLLVARFMEELGFNTFECTATEHDKALGFIQGLNFVTTVSYLSSAAQMRGVERFLTPSFRRRLEAARKMLTIDAEMFEAMFETNPHSQDLVRQFRSHLNIAAGGDISLLVDRAGWWWRDDNQ